MGEPRSRNSGKGECSPRKVGMDSTQRSEPCKTLFRDVTYWPVALIGSATASSPVLSLGASRTGHNSHPDYSPLDEALKRPVLKRELFSAPVIIDTISTSEVGRFETEILSTQDNLRNLMDLSGEWIDKVH